MALLSSFSLPTFSLLLSHSSVSLYSPLFLSSLFHSLPYPCNSILTLHFFPPLSQSLTPHFLKSFLTPFWLYFLAQLSFSTFPLHFIIRLSLYFFPQFFTLLCHATFPHHFLTLITLSLSHCSFSIYSVTLIFTPISPSNFPLYFLNSVLIHIRKDRTTERPSFPKHSSVKGGMETRLSSIHSLVLSTL